MPLYPACEPFCGGRAACQKAWLAVEHRHVTEILQGIEQSRNVAVPEKGLGSVGDLPEIQMGQNYICPVAAGQIKDCIHLRRRKRHLDVCGTSLCRLGCAGGSLVQGRENHRAQSQRFQKSAEPWNGVTAPGQPVGTANQCDGAVW